MSAHGLAVGGWLMLAISFAPGVTAGDPRGAAAAPLRVCADPNNLPFSNARGEGFENAIAALLARSLGVPVQYEWWAQRRGFLRNTLNAHRCDVVMGVPAHMEMLATTAPYYESTYVFVTRRSERLHLRSLDDPRLQRLRIGVPMIGDDGANAPPAHELARRGIVANVIGYSVYGDYRTESPPSALVTAVARGDVDVATVWGPVAGFFSARSREPLDVQPIAMNEASAHLPIAFAIAMGVRRGDTTRLAMLDTFLDQRRSEIDRILAAFHVPRTDRTPRGRVR